MFKGYRRSGIAECRPYILGEDLTNISVSNEDDPPTDTGGMIGRNPQNHNDQWYIAGQYFRDNFDSENPIELEE